ncbi:Arginase, catabolizes arginine to ornithine and urea [Chytridiales sp. JEL 0842]|nr:Arginase, catabolizes arginine to ornithine and urea [Chytridiales sp. JEL 0842]
MSESPRKRQRITDMETIINDRVEQRYIKAPYVVGVIGAGFSGGQPKGGVEQGPTMLVEHGLLKQIEDLGWGVDMDEKFPNYDQFKPETSAATGKLKNATYVSRVCEDVYKTVKATCEKGHMALTLGGDHSLAMGTISGSSAVYKNLGVIWVDAHADINTPETTETGNLHGCPVSFLTGLAGKVDAFKWLKPCLPLDRIVYIGLRDVDAAEKKILRDNGIKAFSMHEVDRWGIGKVMDMVFDYLGRECPIHLSFDVDALDPSVAPSTGTPVRGGLTFREGHYIMETAHQSGALVAIDVMEVNPILGDQEAMLQTIQVGCSLVRSALDHQQSQASHSYSQIMSTPAPIPAFDRTNFGLVASGFALFMIFKYTAVLLSRKLRGTDRIAAAILGAWSVYIIIQVIDLWSKRTTGAIENWFYAINTSTLFYSTVLCGILYMSILRVLALFGGVPTGESVSSMTNKRRLEIAGIALVAIIFLVRGVRTILIFIASTADKTSVPALNANATAMQIATLLPTLLIRLILDIISLYKLYESRVKYVETAGQEAFTAIVISTIAEQIFAVLAIFVAFQEASQFQGNKLSFMDCNIQAIDLWAKRTTGVIDNYFLALNTATLFYSAVLCGILYMSILRVLAFFGGCPSEGKSASLGISINKKQLEIAGTALVVVIFLVRAVSTGFIFAANSVDKTSVAALNANSTAMQIATLVPTLLIRVILDIISLYKLYESRVKYIETAGKQAFNAVIVSTCVEQVWAILAVIVGFQEALQFQGNKLSFMDWYLWLKDDYIFLPRCGKRLRCDEEQH